MTTYFPGIKATRNELADLDSAFNDGYQAHGTQPSDMLFRWVLLGGVLAIFSVGFIVTANALFGALTTGWRHLSLWLG